MERGRSQRYDIAIGKPGPILASNSLVMGRVIGIDPEGSVGAAIVANPTIAFRAAERSVVRADGRSIDRDSIGWGAAHHDGVGLGLGAGTPLESRAWTGRPESGKGELQQAQVEKVIVGRHFGVDDLGSIARIGERGEPGLRSAGIGPREILNQAVVRPARNPCVKGKDSLQLKISRWVGAYGDGLSQRTL